MWTSVKKTNTTAQQMPLVKTLKAHSSANATKDIMGDGVNCTYCPGKHVNTSATLSEKLSEKD